MSTSTELKLAILISGRGSNMTAIVRACLAGTISAMACIGDRAGPARHAGTGPPPAAAAGPAVIDYPALRGYACSCICKFGVSRARAVPVADGFLNGTGHKLPHSYPNHQTCNFHC